MASPQRGAAGWEEGEPLLMAATHDACVPPPHSVNHKARVRATSDGSVNASPRADPADARNAGAEPGAAGGKSADLPPLSFLSSVVVPLWRVMVLVIFMYMSMSLTLAVTPGLITDALTESYDGTGAKLQCSNYAPNDKPSACTEAAAKAALYSSVVSGVTAVLSFLLAPTIGALSDAFGRHPFFILTACTAAAPAVCFAMFALGYAPLWLYYLTNGINYSLPGFSMALAHVADVAPPEHRAAAVGLVIGAFSATFITGPSLSAVLPLEPTLWASIGCSAAAFVWAVVGMRESLPLEDRIPFSCKTLNPLSNLSILLRSKLFVMLAITVALNAACTDGVRDILMYFLIDEYNLQPGAMSTVLIVLGVASLIVQVLLMRPLTAALGHKRLLLLGIAASLADMVVFTAVRQLDVVYAQLAVLMSLAQVTFPTVCAIKSLNVADSEQGRVQGALYGVQQLGGGIGPLAFTSLFKLFSSRHGAVPYFPQAPFALGIVLMLASLLFAVNLPRTTPDLGPQQARFRAKHTHVGAGRVHRSPLRRRLRGSDSGSGSYGSQDADLADVVAVPVDMIGSDGAAA